MKKNTFYTLFLVALGFAFFASCKKDKNPALKIEGNYEGSFEGSYNDFDTLTSSGYQVQITALNDNKVKVFGNHFDQFELLVTTNGINVEPVSKSDPYLLDFIYIGDESKVKFTYNKGGNTAKFIGTK